MIDQGGIAMRIGFEVFLAVCEEMSFSKAAQRLFITQQTASDHIKRLEKEFSVTLFERKPTLHLAPAGEVLLQNLRSLMIVENNMERTLSHYAKGEQGSFNVGVSTSRAHIILPKVLPAFQKEYPLVNISFEERDTKVMEEELLQGKIDLFLGINTDYNPEYLIETIAEDELLLVIHPDLLKKCFSQDEIDSFREGVDLRFFTDVPFVLPNFRTGKVSHAIREYLKSTGVPLRVIYNISDSKTQLELCSSALCAVLSPEMLLRNNRSLDTGQNSASTLCIFPVKGLSKLRIDLVTHKQVHHPPYIVRFMELFRDAVREISE